MLRRQLSKPRCKRCLRLDEGAKVVDGRVLQRHARVRYSARLHGSKRGMRLALSSITEISGKAFFSPSISRIMFKEVMP